MSKKSKVPPRLLLAIDPAAKAGLALFLDGKLVGTRAADGSRWKPLTVAISALLQAVATLPPANTWAVVIEDGWLNKGWGAKGALTLGRRRGIAQSAAEALGFPDVPVFIGPSTWQSKLFGKLAKDESKQRALAFVAQHYNTAGITEDEADAICIGHFALTEAIVMIGC